MAPGAPYMYSATASEDSRFPTSTFDPKAVTRASWEPKPKRKPQNGPLLSFNTHPEYACQHIGPCYGGVLYVTTLTYSTVPMRLCSSDPSTSN